MKLVRLFRAANTARLATWLIALWKLFKHPQTPRAAKVVAILVLGYALSPIDLIPDFIPVLGQLDDIVLIPLGVALAIKLTPKPLWEARMREAEASRERLPKFWWGALLIVAVWILMLGGLAWWLARTFAA
jgi:uncharacterized membrane protein YkvA (DUF1232 family)